MQTKNPFSAPGSRTNFWPLTVPCNFSSVSHLHLLCSGAAIVGLAAKLYGSVRK